MSNVIDFDPTLPHLVQLDADLVGGIADKCKPLRSTGRILSMELDAFIETRTVHDGRRLRRLLEMTLLQTHDPLTDAQRETANIVITDLQLILPKK